MIRRLLALAVLAGGLVLATPAGATAAPCRPAGDTLERQTMRADAVLVGTVAERTVTPATVTYVVDADRIYKGEGLSAQVSIETPGRRCALPRLAEGEEVVWFVEQDGDVLTSDIGAGTAKAATGRVERVEELLGAGTPAVPPEPAEARFTVVADEPADITRHAAPGAALVLVGLLGLLLVVALGRRKG